MPQGVLGVPLSWSDSPPGTPRVPPAPHVLSPLRGLSGSSTHPPTGPSGGALPSRTMFPVLPTSPSSVPPGHRRDPRPGTTSWSCRRCPSRPVRRGRGLREGVATEVLRPVVGPLFRQTVPWVSRQRHRLVCRRFPRGPGKSSFASRRRSGAPPVGVGASTGDRVTGPRVFSPDFDLYGGGHRWLREERELRYLSGREMTLVSVLYQEPREVVVPTGHQVRAGSDVPDGFRNWG